MARPCTGCCSRPPWTATPALDLDGIPFYGELLDVGSCASRDLWRLAVTIRVLHVLEAIEGGTARHVVDIVRHVDGVDHEVVIPRTRIGAPTDHLAAPAIEKAGARIHYLSMCRDPVRIANATALGQLIRLLRARRPGVVHGHSSIGGLLGRVAATACGVRCIYTPHGLTDVAAGIRVERMLGRVTDRFIAVSTSERAHVLSLRLVPAERLVVVPNGIEIEQPLPCEKPPDLRSQFGLPSAATLVGSVSRLVAQKAPEDLVAAWGQVAAAMPDAHFVLIGAGPLQGSLDAAIAKWGLADRVHQIRSLPDAWAVLDQFSVFCLASRFEGAPYALLEATRAGVPIAATDVVGTRDIVQRGRTGLLSPAGNPGALATNVLSLLSDVQRAGNMVSAARQRLAGEFSVEAMGARLVELYRARTGLSP